MFIFLLLFLTSILKIDSVRATEINFHEKFKISAPVNWKATENLFGIPLTLSGPMENNLRPIIAIIPTELDNVTFVQPSENVLADYKRHRLRWLKKHKGEALSFEEYEKTKWASVDEAHVLGYSYIINEIVFYEKSYFVLCKKKLYHLKYLLRESQTQYAEDSINIIRGFRCLK